MEEIDLQPAGSLTVFRITDVEACPAVYRGKILSKVLSLKGLKF